MDKDKKVSDEELLNQELMISAVESNSKLLEKAISNGGDINFQTSGGLNLVMLNIAFGDLVNKKEYILSLIENGINLNHIDKLGNSSLQYASRLAATDIVDLLAKNNIFINTVNEKGYNSLLTACESIPLFFPFYITSWETSVTSLWLPKIRDSLNKDYLKPTGRQHYKKEQLKTIRTLLENEIDKSKLTKEGLSAMDLAILNDYINDNSMVKLLKEYGIKMNSNIEGCKGSAIDTLFYGGPSEFISYYKKDKLIKKKVKEYKK